MTTLYHQFPLFPVTKMCKDCLLEKSPDEFYKGWARCKVCETARRNEAALQRALNPAPILVKSQTCNACRIEKPLEDFYAHRAGKYGRAAVCKACVCAKSAEKYQPKPSRSMLTDNGKICTKCHIEKPLDEFWKSKTGKVIERCRACSAKNQKEWRRKNGAKPRYPVLPPIVNGGRVCIKCLREKPLEEFIADKRGPEGHSNTCKECENAKNRTRYARNENKDQVLAKNQAWYENNKERHAALTKAWRQENRLRVLEHSTERRSRVKSVFVEPVSYESILERDGMWCYICEKDILPGQIIEFDHEIPISRGGPHAEFNIHPVHKSCNRRKCDKLLSEMTPRQRRGV